MLSDRKALIRKMIEEAKPAEEYLAEQAQAEKNAQEASANTPNQMGKRILKLQTINAELASINTGGLTHQELRAVSAVIAYVTYSENVSEELVTEVLKTAFGVDEVKDISSDNYEDAVRFLVEFDFEKALN